MAAHATVDKAYTGSEDATQLGLYDRASSRPPMRPRPVATLCAGCRAREARYGFREDDSPERPRTLCFECFRMELDFRQRVLEQRARGWNARQARLPLSETRLSETLNELTTRRRRAQIAARHALDEDGIIRNQEAGSRDQGCLRNQEVFGNGPGLIPDPRFRLLIPDP